MRVRLTSFGFLLKLLEDFLLVVKPLGQCAKLLALLFSNDLLAVEKLAKRLCFDRDLLQLASQPLDFFEGDTESKAGTRLCHQKAERTEGGEVGDSVRVPGELSSGC